MRMSLGDNPEQFAFHKNDRVRRKMGSRILDGDGIVLEGWIDYEPDGRAARIKGEWYKIKWDAYTPSTREEFEAGELVEVVATFHGMTETHGFRVTLSRHAAPHCFVGEISGFTPPVAPRLVSGQPVQMMKHYELDPVADQDLRCVVDLAKERVSAQWGKILVFRDQ